MTQITAILAWILYSVFEGIREGYYFNANPTPTKFNIHILFNIQRIAVLTLIFIIAGNIWIACCFMFPFIHDGAYYMTRNKLNKDVYLKGFWDNPSSTSTAILDFELWKRIFLFSFSILLIVVSYVCKS